MFSRKEEETFDIILRKPDMRFLETPKQNEIIEKLNGISQQVDLLSRYVSHLSKKLDDSLVLIKLQEEKIKDLESRIEALTAREL